MRQQIQRRASLKVSLPYNNIDVPTRILIKNCKIPCSILYKYMDHI